MLRLGITARVFRIGIQGFGDPNAGSGPSIWIRVADPDPKEDCESGSSQKEENLNILWRVINYDKNKPKP